MTPADLELPDDVDALKAMIMAMAAKAARADVLEDEVADLKAPMPTRTNRSPS